MPNRGPLDLSAAEASALLDELPPPGDTVDAEADQDDRRRIALLASARKRIAEVSEDLSKRGAPSGVVILSIDEAEEVLDCLPPPPALASVRERLVRFRQATLGSGGDD